MFGKQLLQPKYKTWQSISKFYYLSGGCFSAKISLVSPRGLPCNSFGIDDKGKQVSRRLSVTFFLLKIFFSTPLGCEVDHISANSRRWNGPGRAIKALVYGNGPVSFSLAAGAAVVPGVVG